MKFTRIVIRLLIILFFYGLGLLLFSCGSKKKTISNESEEIRKESSLDSLAKIKFELQNNSSSNSSDKNTEVEKEIEYDGCEGDSLTIIEKGPDGKVLSETVIKGKGKAKIKSKEKSNESKKTATQDVKVNAEAETKVKKKDSEDSSKSKRVVDKEKPGIVLGFWFSFWFWFILFLIALGIYLNKRFNWLGKIKKYVAPSKTE